MLCKDTRLVPCWHVGNRNLDDAVALMEDLAGRLTHRPEITTDAHGAYPQAIDIVFAHDVDHAMLIKEFRADGMTQQAIHGRGKVERPSTSLVERQNLTMRMSMRRFALQTNAFSRNAQNHAHAVALHYMHYNFCRTHETLRVTPAMEAGVTDHFWNVSDVVELIEELTPKPGPRGPYRRRN